VGPAAGHCRACFCPSLLKQGRNRAETARKRAGNSRETRAAAGQPLEKAGRFARIGRFRATAEPYRHRRTWSPTRASCQVPAGDPAAADCGCSPRATRVARKCADPAACQSRPQRASRRRHMPLPTKRIHDVKERYASTPYVCTTIVRRNQARLFTGCRFIFTRRRRLTAGAGYRLRQGLARGGSIGARPHAIALHREGRSARSAEGELGRLRVTVERYNRAVARIGGEAPRTHAPPSYCTAEPVRRAKDHAGNGVRHLSSAVYCRDHCLARFKAVF
jgi:hypothetical protein